ncbi:MAG: phage portal protein [Thiotrichaceae bacterium]
MSRKPFAIGTTKGKAVLTSFLETFARKDSSRSLNDDAFLTTLDSLGLREPRYGLEHLLSLLEVNTWHGRACRTKANDVGGLGWSIKPKDTTSPPPDTEKGSIKNLFENGIEGAQSFEDMLTQVQLDFEAVGMGYIEVAREGFNPDGIPAILKRLPAHTMRIHGELNRFAQVRGNRKVWFKRFGYPRDVHWKTGEEFTLGSLNPEDRANEVIQIKQHDPLSSFYGVPEIIPALVAVEGLRALAEYNVSFFDNFGVPSYAVYVTGDYDLGKKIDSAGRDEDDPEFDATTGEYEIITEIETHLASLKDNPQAPLILAIPSVEGGGEVKIHFEALAVEVKESSFKLYRKDNRDEILVAHGMPPYRIGIVETGTLGSNVADNADKVYKESVLTPRKRLLQTAITITIIQIGFQFEGWVLWLNELDTGDEAFDIEVATFMFKRGSITPNEIIRTFGDRFGLTPSDDPALNLHYINNQPIDGIAITSETLTAIKSFHKELINLAIADKVQDEST